MDIQRVAANSSLEESTTSSDMRTKSICILLVLDDFTCHNIVTDMLHNQTYEVLHVGKTMDTINAIWERKSNFNLVLTNIHRLNTNGVDILQIIKNKLNLPTILMSPDDTKHENQVQDCSVAAYVVSFSDTNEMNKLWQMALEKEKGRKEAINQEENNDENASRMPQNVTETSTENTSSADNDADIRAHLKGKRKADNDENEENGENTDIKKKRRVIWTPKMHQNFLRAIQQLGHEKAVPKKIVEIMNEPGLTREHVASHLQKYRMCLKRAQESSAATSIYDQLLSNDARDKCFQFQPCLSSPHFNASRGYSHSIRQPFQTHFQRASDGLGQNLGQPQMVSIHNNISSFQEQNSFLKFPNQRQTNNSGLIGKQFTSLPRLAHRNSNFRVYGDKTKNMLFSIQSCSTDQPTNSNSGLDFIGFKLSKDGKSVHFGHKDSSCAVISTNAYSGQCSSLSENYIHNQQSSPPFFETPIENNLIQGSSAPPENFTFHNLQASLLSTEQHPSNSISEKQSHQLLFKNATNKISCQSSEMPASISGDLEDYSALLFGDEVSVPALLENCGNYDCTQQEYSAPDEINSFGAEVDIIKSLLETTDNRSSQLFWEGDFENELY